MKKSFLKKVFNFFIITVLISMGSSITYLFTRKKRLKNKYQHTNFCSGSRIDYEGEVFEGTSFGLIFSGLDISFKDAVLKDNQAVLNIYGEFSGVNIKVPSHWNVKVEGISEKSGVNNPFGYNEDNVFSPQLTINYDLVYSGLNIKKVDSDLQMQGQEFDDEEKYFVDEGEDDTKVIRIKKIKE